MEKKKSKGVTLWAWIFIVFSLWGILDFILNFHMRIQRVNGLFIFHILSCLAYLMCGFFLLQLKETARKAAIYLGLISIIVIPFYLMPVVRSYNTDNYYAKKEKMILEQMKPEHQPAALENLRKGTERSKKIMPLIILGCIGIPILVLESLPIYFFTRPTIKEQFAGIKST
jgi:hypothetical protein